MQLRHFQPALMTRREPLARTRIVLGVALAVVALAYGAWEMRGWQSYPSTVLVPVALIGMYGLAALAGLFGPRMLRDAAFGLALFGGADFLLGEVWGDRILATRSLAAPLHIRAFNAAWGTHLTGAEQNGGFLAPPDPAITAMRITRGAAFQASSLAFGLVGLALAVVLGRWAPLRPWSRGVKLAALAAGLAGMTAGFVLPSWWASSLAFHAVLALFLAAALGARFGPPDARPRLFGFALVGGTAFLLGSYRFIPEGVYPAWLYDPVGVMVVKLGMWGVPEVVSGTRPNVVTGYLPTPEPRWARIRLVLLFSAIPVGLLGAGLAVGAARVGPGSRRFRSSGTLRAMVAIAASAVVLMAFRSAQWPWTVIEHQMIFGLGLAVAFRARFGPARGRAFFTGSAAFGLANVAMVATALKYHPPLSQPIVRGATSAWEAIHGSPYEGSGTLKMAPNKPRTVQGIDPYHHYSATIDVAYTTSSLATALVGGTLCALMIPAKREPNISPV